MEESKDRVKICKAPLSGHDTAIVTTMYSSCGYLHQAYQKLIMGRGRTHEALLYFPC